MQKETSYKIGFICVTIIALLLFIALLKPTVTGFFFTPEDVLLTNILVSESKTLDIDLPNNLKYFAISGEIIGSGNVSIYLTNNESNLLVWDNAKNTRNDKITGFVPNRSEQFIRACIETCAITQTEGEWHLSTYVEPGTKLKITEIIYK